MKKGNETIIRKHIERKNNHIQIKVISNQRKSNQIQARSFIHQVAMFKKMNIQCWQECKDIYTSTDHNWEGDWVPALRQRNEK